MWFALNLALFIFFWIGSIAFCFVYFNTQNEFILSGFITVIIYLSIVHISISLMRTSIREIVKLSGTSKAKGKKFIVGFYEWFSYIIDF